MEAVVGAAILDIKPKVTVGLANVINAEINAANVGGIGKKAGGLFSGGFTEGASFGVWSKVASTAMDAVSNSLGNAAARVDTLNNYPKVMESLGVETDDAAKSIQTMSDGLSNVPTKLDDMAATTEGIYAATKKYGTSLETVTDAGLALNSMLLAGGQSTGVVNAAMEQFRQMVSKGKPELQDWRSLISAAPGQMEQLAESMLGAGKTADDLYKALGGGQQGQAGVDFMPEISMGEFVERFAKLKDRFTGDAEEAQGGIQTAFANMQNAVTRGVAGVLDAIGQENISGAINDVKGWINDLFGFIQNFARDVAPVVSGVWDAVSGVVDGVGDLATKLSEGFRYGFDGLEDGKGKVADLNSAISDIVGLNEGAGGSYSTLADAVNAAMDSSRDATRRAKDAHEDYLSAVTNAADRIREANTAYEGDYRRLETAAEVIETYGNKADTTAGQQWELKRAIETVNDMCGSQYKVLEDGYTIFDESTGKVQDNTEAILDNIEARKYAVKAEAIGAALAEEEKVYDAAAAYYAEQKRANEDAIAAMDLLVEKYGSVEEVERRAKEALSRSQTGGIGGEDLKIIDVYQAWRQASEAMDDATNKMREAEGATSALSTQYDALNNLAEGGKVSMYDLAAASGVAAQALQGEGKTALNDFAYAIDQCASSAGDSGEKLKTALADPQTMADIVASYDGTAASLQGVFEGLGVTWDAAKAKELDAVDGFALMRDSLMNMGDVLGVLSETGTSADDLAQRLTNAGISAQDMANLGGDGFRRLANECNGNLDAVIVAIKAYNDGAIVADKSGKVTVNDEQLKKALDKLYEFDKHGNLTDKNGNVLVKHEELVDAYEYILKANDTKLEDKSAAVHVDDGGLPSLIDQANEFIRLPDNTEKRATFVTDNITNHIDNYSSGGHAAGGHIEPRHAGGFIAAGPTHTKYGLVGEDGIEATWVNDDGSMDVYPLNNPRYLGYAKPLAESIAANIAPLVGGGDTYIINGLTVPAESELASYMRKVIKGAIREGRA